MCGIVGIFDIEQSQVELPVLKRMNDTLSHRGPNDEGYLLVNTFDGTYQQLAGVDSVEVIRNQFEDISSVQDTETKFNLALGHRRLSIIDLSSSGHQPMFNEDFTVWMVYNGEIYNYIELKEELQSLGHIFRSDTDSEVIIHSYEEWGIDCLNKFNGMWAFAIWDQKEQRLFCARDRFGIKPFYYHFNGKNFYFSSEIKSLLQCDIKCSPNENAIGNYLAFGMKDYSDETFFTNIKQLLPGHCLTISDENVDIIKYYDLSDSSRSVNHSNFEQYKESVRNLLEDSIKLRLRSDVPVGSNLSGGLDSSIIVSCISKLFKIDNYLTYSFFTRDLNTDESKYINIVSEETGVTNKHTYLENVDEHSINATIKKMDEPFRSFGILSIDSVFKLISSDNTKVILDGQGADEIFYGYGYHYTYHLFNYLKQLKILTFLNEFNWTLHYNKGINASLTKLIVAMFVPCSLKEKIKRYTLKKEGILMFPSRFENLAFTRITDMNLLVSSSLIKSPLPEYLNFEDKISMSYSIESRVPFLDHRLVECSMQVPNRYKIHHGVRKYILRESFKDVIPYGIYNRMDKKGMTNDEELLFKTSLKKFALGIYSSPEFNARKYWDSERILEQYDLFLSGNSNYLPIFWRVIAVELWLRIYW